MDTLDFDNLDNYLLKQNGKIIHQVWFGDILPTKRATKKAFDKLQSHRNSWLLKNPDWTYICWNVKRANELIRYKYAQHLELYKSYPYSIQRCDVIRYFFLHRYGGLYADMDYHCNRSWNEVLQNFPSNFYLVETPNKVGSGIHVSNSLMYSQPNHIFWSKLFIELELHKSTPLYYSRHMIIMFTTGPSIISRVFNKYKSRYRLKYYPFKYFHPFGLAIDEIMLQNKKEIYAYHLGKGSWETKDSKILIFLYTEWKVLLALILILITPSIFYSLLSKSKINSHIDT